ncbi:MAG: HEAT repeat domain-containing protein, partial [Myxococcota bacterium]
ASAFDALAFLEAEAGAAGEMRVAELALRSVYNEIRLRALQLLVKFGGEGAHAGERELAKRADDLLGDALDDEHSKVREEAFRTLWAWHSASPEPALTRAAASRHADLRKRMVGELARLTDQPWADALLLTLAKDASESVGLAAYAALLDVEANKTRKEVHEAALSSPSPKVIARACATINASAFLDLRGRLLDFLEDERIVVSKAALRAFDRLKPSDEAAFSRAFGSIFYELRTTAIELCGRRRDTRCIVPARALLALPETDSNRPSPKLRQRIARALADVGHGSLIPFFVNLLSDTDGLVREYAARGIATAARPGHAQPLVDNLAHEDLAVRSWLAEGLARLGDPRALPVLAGTLGHDHRPIRLGAIMGFAALGPEGTRGLLMGLDDADREIQDLVFAAIVARDIALAEKGLAPDLLLSALSSTHPEVRFAAARFIEARMAGDVRQAARELVGPIKPSKAADMEKWPEEADRDALQDILVRALSSDDPPLRYAATQVLALRPKADAYWREIKRLQGPVPAGALRIPHTNWADENATPRKRGWMRTLVQGLDASGDASLRQLIFGVYAGLVRQAPTGDADETHRIRRDALGRIQALATHVGESAALPVIRRGLDDPHHLVRKAAVTALKQLHADGDKTPLTLMLRARAADVGKAAVDELIAAAPNDNAAKDLAVGALEAPNADVRSHALGRLPSLYEQGSLEPFLIALRSRFSDVRLAVVNRLVGSQDDRVADALGKAMESEHEDLQLRAAEVLAARGDRRTLDILAGMLRSENAKVVGDAGQALVRLSQARFRERRSTG